MGPTTELRRALKDTFFPLAAARGFAVDTRLQPRSTVFRRRRGDRVEMFEVQWEKYGRPRFAIRFGTCPAAGLRVGDAVHAAEDALPTWCADAGTLRPPGGGEWFRQDAGLVARLAGRPRFRAPAAVVDELVTAWSAWERSGRGSA